MGSLTAAQQLDSWGLNVLPAHVGGKVPSVEWRRYINERTSPKLAAWFSDQTDSNFWIACGAVSGVVVLDCDSDSADNYWRGLLGDLLDRTAAVRTRKGYHYYFRLPSGQGLASWSWHDKEADVHFDVRADGTGVIAPPSIHESGHVYEWVRTPDQMQPVPDELLSAAAAGLASESGAQMRSMLAQLLNNPPAEGGRNDWLARVAGHYAKMHSRMVDLYEVECERANAMLSPPLEEAEFQKTVRSIWKSEQSKGDAVEQEVNESNGWLVGTGDTLLAPVRYKQGEEWVTELKHWANFDVVALGVVDDEEAERVYDVEIHRQRQGDVRTTLLPARVISDPRQLDRWLANLGVGISPPPEKELVRVKYTTRLASYIESQAPPHFQVVSALGWHEDRFICHEGGITQHGLTDHQGLKPDPILRNRAPFSYGFIDQAEAVAVLNEVLTYHYPVVASVFGSWWAACLLKPQLQAVSSQFPFMALEAPSESGKTTGMFSKLIQLNGNMQGQTSYTPASLRNAIASHHSGIVWIDDEDSMDHLMHLLRMATGEGSYTKMAEDHHSSVTVQLVAPVLVSGEALVMNEQKALRDRAVMLEVNSPTGRRSTKNPGSAQWDDIVDLTSRYPDLSVMAGNMVQLALNQSHWVGEMSTLRTGSKRFGDKIGILRVGARILAGMTGDPGHVDVVEDWVNDQIDTEFENTLTLKLLPLALRALQWPSAVIPGERDRPMTPVYLHEGEVRFSVPHLAEWWDQYKHGRIEQRTESRTALEQQAKTLGLAGTTKVRVPGSVARPRYWRLTPELSATVIARSNGEGTEDGADQQWYLDGTK